MTPAEADRLAPELFEGERLTVARLYLGLHKIDVARAIHVTPAAVGQYEQGRTRPSPAVLAALALRLGFPPTFFERGRPIIRAPEGQAHFRRLRSTSKMDRDRILARISLLAEIVAEVERRVELPVVDVPDLVVDEDDLGAAEDAGAEVRERWGLGTGPIDNMVRLLETNGVIVVRPPIDTSEIDAFSTVMGGRPIVVLASNKDDAARSRFDAGHELGHLAMHHDAKPGHAPVERAAQRFAAAFLLPAESLRNELPSRLRWDVYFELKHRWKVSLAALLYRARTLGVLSPDAYQRAQVRMSQRGWRDQEPGDIGAPEQPRLLQRALDLMKVKLGMAPATIASAARLSEDVFADLVADVVGAAEHRPTLRVT
jgi:Zn-dependent peptidase ImmA (M78 family)/transcriptional regulator with XRE-family HTH domain